MSRSQQWKSLERAAAEALGGNRVLRGANFAVSDVDVLIPDLPFLKVDAKYRVKHAHHTFMAEIKAKYCTKPTDIPVLVTKSHNQVGAYATVPLAFLGALLDVYRRETEDIGRLFDEGEPK